MNNLFDDSKSNQQAGFRLSYAEFFNWGTFSNTYKGDIIAPPHRITPELQTVALQGKKGSGKSTIVDGLITLLVPPPRNRNLLYNQASGISEENKKSKGRTDETYFWGEYGEYTDNNDQIQSKRLREVKDNHHTILLACFDNGIQRLTLAQVWFWKTDSIKKMYIVCPKALKIEEHFTNLDFDTLKLRKQFERLSSESKVFTDDFNGYQQYFRDIMGIHSEDALKLFHKIVGSKELGNIDKVIKQFILQDGTEAVNEKIEDMYRSNESLMKIKKMMDDAERQSSLLTPIISKSENFEKLNHECSHLENLIKQLPNYITIEKERPLTEAIETNKKELADLENQLTEIASKLEDLRLEEVKIKTAKDSIDIQKIIEGKEKRLDELQKTVNTKKQKAEDYEELTKDLGFSVNIENEKAFKANTNQAVKEQKSLSSDIENAANILIELKVDEQSTTKQYNTKIAELRELEKRPKSNIPIENQRIREQLIKELGVKETDIPFIGELIQVKEDFKEWELAIEKLLRGFALNMLVLEKYEKRTNRFININNMKGIATYKAVQSSNFSNYFSEPSTNGVFEKLELKASEPFKSFLRTLLLKDFDYECFEEDDDNFRKTDKGITIKGLQNQKGGNYRKDDRNLRPVLGWDTFANIEAVRSEAESLFSQKSDLSTKIKSQETALKKQRERSEKLKELVKFESFYEIDYKKDEMDSIKLNQEIEKLKITPKNKEWQALQTQLNGVLKDIKDLETNQLEKNTNRKGFEKLNVTYEGILEETKKDLLLIANEDVKPFITDFENYFQNEPLSAKNFELQEANAKNKFIIDSKEKVELKNNQKSQLEGLMKDYLRDFPSSMLFAKVECLSDFERKHNDIQNEDLPKYKTEFELKLKDDFRNSFFNFESFLKETLLNQVSRDIRETNLMLKENTFEGKYYLQLEKKSNDEPVDIISFKKRLRDISEGTIGITQEYSQLEVQFKKIQELLNEFKFNPKAQQRLTDVRNWVSFYIRKYDKNSNKPTDDIYNDSSGKSGGQQTILAYTVLASAIAKQFGANSTISNSKSKSFRLVILDEAFSKLDSEDPKNVMQIFKDFNLQLIVVIPDRDRLNIIPKYLGWIHYVYNSESGDKSQIAQLELGYNPQKFTDISS